MDARAPHPKRQRPQCSNLASFLQRPDGPWRIGARARVAIDKMFENDHIMRVWTGIDGTTPTLTTLPESTAHLEATLYTNGFGALYGMPAHNFHGNLGDDNNPLQSHGLQKLSHGSYNQIWCGKMNANSRRVFPDAIATLVEKQRVVIRGPLNGTTDLTRTQITGEIRNVLHAALVGYGPLVAGMTWVRTRHESTQEEGLVIVKYRLIAFMERADESVHDRIDSIARSKHRPMTLGNVFAHRDGVEAYFGAFLQCIYAYSTERFVYLDAGLRNFVDYVRGTETPRVKVVDIDPSVFKRLSNSQTVAPPTQASAGWQLLWLHNVLVVSCLLKNKLANLTTLGSIGGGMPGLQNCPTEGTFNLHWWSKIERAVTKILELARDPSPGDAYFELARDFITSSRWTWVGSAADNADKTNRWCNENAHDRHPWLFPTVSAAPYAGPTTQATAKSALAYAYHYFIMIPLYEIDHMYTKRMMLSKSEKAAHGECARKAMLWFDTNARLLLVPSIFFFYNAVRRANASQGGPMLVEIMAEFARTPLQTLQRRCLHNIPLSATHTDAQLSNFSRYILGRCVDVH